jgi:regulator of cell morphogenesis and NO signaling
MYRKGKYRETDKMSDLIGGNYPMLLVMSRFGIPLGFGEKNVKEVCKMQ